MASARDQERLALLQGELVAIDKWDESYHRDKTHHTSDEFSYQARQLRRRQIMREIELLRSDLLTARLRSGWAALAVRRPSALASASMLRVAITLCRRAAERSGLMFPIVARA